MRVIQKMNTLFSWLSSDFVQESLTFFSTFFLFLKYWTRTFQTISQVMTQIEFQKTSEIVSATWWSCSPQVVFARQNFSERTNQAEFLCNSCSKSHIKHQNWLCAFFVGTIPVTPLLILVKILWPMFREAPRHKLVNQSLSSYLRLEAGTRLRAFVRSPPWECWSWKCQRHKTLTNEAS